MELFFPLSDLPLEQSSKKQFSTGKILSKRPSRQFVRADTTDHDTFDHVLQITAQHEAIMAYYYMDDNNKVRSLCYNNGCDVRTHFGLRCCWQRVRWQTWELYVK